MKKKFYKTKETLLVIVVVISDLQGKSDYQIFMVPLEF